MSGWLAAAGVAGLAWLLMRKLAGLPRIAWAATAAALVLALTGYGLIGRPSLPGAPAPTVRARAPVDERAIDLRQRMGEGFGTANNWLIASEGALRAGLARSAVTYVRSGLEESPRSPDLWVGLGNALVAQAEGQLSPAARLAYARALQLAPRGPAPRFFLGLASARSGDVERARALWTAVLRDAPANADWRGDVAAALAGLPVQPVSTLLRTPAQAGARDR